MGQVLIRNLDDGLIEDFRQYAADRGRSLEAELRDALAAMRPKRRLSGDELIALAHRLWAEVPDRAAMSDSTAAIRQDRDSR